MNTVSDKLSFIKGAMKDKRVLGAVIILVGVGLLLMLVALGSGDGSSSGEMSAEEAMEKRLEELCSGIDGVGKCRVMISCSYVYQGYGKEPYLRVESVAVVCRGGKRAEVKEALVELLTSLYGIGSNRVAVLVLKN